MTTNQQLSPNTSLFHNSPFQITDTSILFDESLNKFENCEQATTLPSSASPPSPGKFPPIIIIPTQQQTPANTSTLASTTTESANGTTTTPVLDDAALKKQQAKAKIQEIKNRAKNGTPYPIMMPGPEHIYWQPPGDEPLYKPPEGIISHMKWLDSQRKELENPEILLNRVVFDSIAPNPQHEIEEKKKKKKKKTQASSWGDSIAGNAAAEGLLIERSVTPTSPGSAVPAFVQSFLTPSSPANNESGDESTPTTSDVNTSLSKLKPYYIVTGPEDTTLVFESRFESGNLRMATQIYEFEYDLRLNYDVHTRGHTQWFYFSVTNVRPGIKYKFNITNLLKPDSLFNTGMQPLVYSVSDAATKGKGWFRAGFDICYYENTIKRSGSEKHFYTLTWSYVFENEGDTYYFAHCYPYTFSDLQKYLMGLEAEPKNVEIMKRTLLCKSLAGNKCDLLTITNFSSPESVIKNRKGIIISARVHPGESNASYLMKGVIDFLLGPSVDAKILRDNFVFRVVPMLNPDGVINGNYRCSLAGVDLNRKWDKPQKSIHPSIFHLKKLIKTTAAEREVVLFTDLHGHSRKKSIFMYGCTHSTDTQKRIEMKVFPKLVETMNEHFSFKNCSFNLHQSKNSTARVVVHTELNVLNSFTMEASICGPHHLERHFTIVDYEEMGKTLCVAVWKYTNIDLSPIRLQLELSIKKKKKEPEQNVAGNEVSQQLLSDANVTSNEAGSIPTPSKEEVEESAISIGSDSDVRDYTIIKKKKKYTHKKFKTRKDSVSSSNKKNPLHQVLHKEKLTPESRQLYEQQLASRADVSAEEVGTSSDEEDETNSDLVPSFLSKRKISQNISPVNSLLHSSPTSPSLSVPTPSLIPHLINADTDIYASNISEYETSPPTTSETSPFDKSKFDKNDPIGIRWLVATLLIVLFGILIRSFITNFTN